MTKNEIVNYVVETPQNVNKNILGQKLDELQKNVSWNDLKDKPFYTETETFTILENYFVERSQDNEHCFADVVVDKAFAFGDKVAVTVYGKQYECIAGNDGGEIFVYEPDVFHLVCFEEEGELLLSVRLMQGEGNLTITVTHEIVHKLDTKFLPGSTVIVTIEEGKLVSHTFDEIVDILGRGHAVILYDGFDNGYFHLHKSYDGMVSFYRCNLVGSGDDGTELNLTYLTFWDSGHVTCEIVPLSGGPMREVTIVE